MRTKSILALFLLLAGIQTVTAQYCCESDRDARYQTVATAYDSALASRIPVVTLPESYRVRSLPAAIDNSTLPYFPGIYAQYLFFSCQQYAGVTYTYTYEVNRLRNVAANVEENRYPAHYTWNFLNYGGQFVGVNFLHTFHALMQQGQMSRAEYGPDTATRYLGWVSGYDKYEKAFPNRILGIKSIPINSEEGILTMKHYLNDHLDGSATGGVACFTAAGPTNISVIPSGLPEAGKHIVLNWQPWATHGMTIVGYDDSIRYDLNGDGQCTNNIDITGDGIVNAQDWEIGAFKFANSYGAWWADGGYGYALYHSFACPFEQGGVWNNCVYMVEPDTAYVPLLGMEFKLKYNQRNQLRITAGVNADSTADFPAHTMEFPFFNFQGGGHVMQGIDSIPGQDEIELGLDVTPLLTHITPGQPAKFFFIVEENDPYQLGSGLIRHVAFHDYSGEVEVFESHDTDVPVTNQGVTYVSAIGRVDFSPVQITTESLPPAAPGVPWSAQLTAGGGKRPYQWALVEQCQRSPVDPGYTGVNDIHLIETSDEIPYAQVVLPFSFPFFGTSYDTVYMNSRGMLQFTNDQLPYPYLIGWDDMLRKVPLIFPAFSWYHRISYADSDGMWVRKEPGKVTFHWQVSVANYESGTDNSFELVLFPDGSFEFHYGNCSNTGTADRVMTGYSKGDDISFEINETADLASLSGQSFHYTPPKTPDGLNLSDDGLLSLNTPQAENLYDIRVRVSDEQLFTDEKEFQFTPGLRIKPSLPVHAGMACFGESLPMDILLTNPGQASLDNLQLVLRSADTLILITDSTDTYANLGAGQSAQVPGAFAFQMQEHYPDGALLWFTIQASAGTSHWNYTFPVTVSETDLRLTTYNLHDGANSLLDPGEVADLEVAIGNFGSRDADSVTVTISMPDTSISLLTSAVVEQGLLQSNEAMNLSLRLQASRYIPAGSSRTITLDVTAATGISKEFTIDLQLGSRPVALVNLTSYTSSIAAMKWALDTVGATYDQYTWLGPHLLNYPVIFLVLGTTTGSHFLTDDEGSFFANYLANGGRLYMESYAEWSHNTTELNSFFHYTTQQVPAYYFEDIQGLSGTFCEGLAYPYLGTSYISVNDFTPADPAFSIIGNTDLVPRPLQIAYDGDDYKTIGSMIEFGKLSDGPYPSTRTELMRRYLNFFDVIYHGPFPYFHADSTTVCRFHPVQFTDDSYDNVTSWHWEFPGGQPWSSDLRNPTVIYPSEGRYDVTLTISDGTTTHTLTRKDFVRVEVCAGEEEASPLSAVIVYPNPAGDRINIRLPEGITDPVSVMLYDVTGKVCRKDVVRSYGAGSVFSLSTAGLKDGFYFLRMVCQTEAVSRKIVISNN